MGLAAGDLNRRVHIQRRGQGADGFGQPLEVWENITAQPLWANIAGKSGLQTAAADTEVSVSRYSIRIRYRRQVEADMRVVEVGAGGVLVLDVIYDIRAVLHDLAGRDFTDLVCETRRQHG